MESVGIRGEGRQSITEDKDFSLPETPVNLIRLDLACGQTKKGGYIGVDYKDLSSKYPAGEFKQVNLEQYPWPFEDSSVYEIYCSHYVEHISDLKAFMEEVYRILVPMGSVTLIGPYWANVRCWQDFTHKRALTDVTMKYFDQTWLKANGLDHYDVKADFESINTVYVFNEAWKPRANEAKMYALKHYINVVDDIQYILRTVKPMRS